MIYLLDTDHVSELQGGGAAGVRLVARLRQIAPDDYGTTIITFEEQMRGRLAQVAASPTVSSYAFLNATFRFYSNLAVWQYHSPAEQLVVAWKQARLRVGTQDMKIAAIASVAGATLLSNAKVIRCFAPALEVPGYSEKVTP